MIDVFVLSRVVGGGLLAVSSFAGEADLDLDGDSDALRVLSIRSLTYFAFGFGAVGTGLRYLGDGGGISLYVAATIGGLLVAATSEIVFRYLERTDSGQMEAESALIVIVPPNSAAVITGRTRIIRNPDGTERKVGYRSVIGGRTLRIPIIEKVQWLSLETIPLEVKVHNAYSRGNIPLEVEAIANVKIASTPEAVFNNAVERLLGKNIEELEGLARETLTGNLRGVLATLTPEEVNEDRLKFASELIDEADTDLSKLGLQLDVLKVQNVSDERGYLEAIGRSKTAEVLRSARVAEAENDREAKVAEAGNNQTAENAARPRRTRSVHSSPRSSRTASRASRSSWPRSSPPCSSRR